MAEVHVADGTLSCVLAGWTAAPAPVHAVFASSRYMDPKVRGFVDLSLACFKVRDEGSWGDVGSFFCESAFFRLPDVLRLRHFFDSAIFRDSPS